jgi:DNA replication protein DnaC
MTTAEEILAGLANFDELIANAPDEPTLEEIEAGRADREQAALQARQTAVLSPDRGWPAKSLYDAQNVPLRGQKWQLAYDTALEILRSNGIVILYGQRGPGKTRMAAELAVALGFGEYRTAMDFFVEVRATFKPRSPVDEGEVIDALTIARFLVLDEMQVRGGTVFESNLLTHLVDKRYSGMRPTVLIANLTHDQLAESLGASIVDRVAENGAVIHCDWPSFRTSQNA